MYIVFSFLVLVFLIHFSLRHSWWRKNIPFSVPRILTYHMICEHLAKKESKFNRLRVKPQDFEKQVGWLKRNGWTSYTLTELVENKDTLPDKSIAITIDDGFEDNYINAFPVLVKHNFKATIFPVVNRFNRDWATDKDLLKSTDELNSEPMLSKVQIDEMLNSGLVEIGSHTLNHLDLTKLNDEEKENEICGSKKELEKEHNYECTSLVYPFGYYDDKVVSIVKACGYKAAASGLVVGYDKIITDENKYQLKRVLISGRQSFLDFKLKVLKGRNR